MPAVNIDGHVFTPLKIRGLALANRIMMSPMSQHRATRDGAATDWHLVHYGSRAAGGVGLIMIEDCAVSPEGRLSESSLGLYNDSHVVPLKRIVDYCHEVGAAVGIQLGHAGRKAFGAQGPPAGINRLSATGEPFFKDGPRPKMAGDGEWARVFDDFQSAAQRALDARFDALEIHGAHGYLLHEATDAAARCGEPSPLRAIVQRIRRECGESLAIFTRISAGASAEGDLTVEQGVALSAHLESDGTDVIDVSSGGLVPFVEGTQPDPWPRVAQTIRGQTRLKTIGLGGVKTIEDAEQLLSKEACDLVGVGRALLEDPYWLRRQVGTA